MKKYAIALCLMLVLPLFAVGTANALHVAKGGMGDALLGELYRVNMDGDNSYTTFFTVTNTTDRTVTIHVRLRSGKYSIEIWDRQIDLTPYDKTWFQLGWSEDYQEYRIYGEALSTEGDSLRKTLINAVGFAAPARDEDVSIGYIEVFGVGVPGCDCDEGDEFCGVPNGLLGHVYMGDWQTGEYVGYRMLAFADFRTGWVDSHRDLRRYYGWINKGMTAKYPQWTFLPDDLAAPTKSGTIVRAPDLETQPYENPDWATTHGITWNDGDDENDSGIPDQSLVTHYPSKELADAALAKLNLGPSANWSLDDVEMALYKAGISTDYFNISRADGTSLTTLGVVTFPAKYLHFFYQNWNPGIGFGNNDVAKTQRAALKTPPAKVAVWMVNLYDMTEQLWGYSPTELEDLPWEVNLIPVGDVSQEYFKDWPLLYTSNPFNTTYEMGWFQILFNPAIDWWENSNNPALFQRGKYIYPGVSLVMNYEDTNYPHVRTFDWHWKGGPYYYWDFTDGRTVKK